jgi:putative DNA methylase
MAEPALAGGQQEISELKSIMNDKPRLIEVAFPLKQASLDSVHEKNVRHAHISTLHIWPARRPLAACRAALIATLLPDPGDPEERAKILQKLGGHVVPTIKKKKMPSGKIEEIKAEETEGGILHWGRENGPDLEWFRDAIRKAYDGRAPKVLDPFAGGGAIPLEAMRLGCEATAIDINPVAWFILKCTLEYPQKLAGQKLNLPEFALQDREFMTEYFQRGLGLKGASLKRRLARHFGDRDEQMEHDALSGNVAADDLKADLAWHVRAWGKWVLKQARKELAQFYPTYATWEPVLETEKRKVPKEWLVRWKKEHASEIEAKGLRLCPMTANGEVDEKKLNEELTAEDLNEPTNPRWVPKPTVAYLWARTVKNKHHPETTIPLLKTRWLCRRDNKRVLLTIQPKTDGSGVEFGLLDDVPRSGGNTAQRREHDKKLGAGTMSRSGVKCPVHGNILTMEDLRLEGKTQRLGAVMSVVVVDGPLGKEYRLPTEHERTVSANARIASDELFKRIPYGFPTEATPGPSGSKFNSSSLRIYGFESWTQIFGHRQLVALGTFVLTIRNSALVILEQGYPPEWAAGLLAYIVCGFDRMLDFNSQQVSWITSVEAIGHTFVRYAFPITWDYSEAATVNYVRGGYQMSLEAVTDALRTAWAAAENGTLPPGVIRMSAKKFSRGSHYDLIVTDPPYYDAIAYADLMDFFHVWLRRIFSGSNLGELAQTVDVPSPRWDPTESDGELIDNPVLYGGDKEQSKAAYQKGMQHTFERCHESLTASGKMVVVFAHKHPTAWEALVAAILKAGFVVDGSWPIQTEQAARMRAQSSAALSSSVWLVCKKRNPAARPGWDNTVLQQMREKTLPRLRDFWDVGIRGPDFVWSATGPALEAYSQYPVVKKANKPNELMSVSEFLRYVRRMVLDFIVGRVLSRATGGEAATEEMDDVTTYYLLHRNDFKMGEAPAGACILYAVSCNLSDRNLADAFDLLVPSGGTSDGEEEEEEGDEDDEEMVEGSSSTFKLKPWNKRKRPGMGYDPVVDSPKARMEPADGKLIEGGSAAEKPRTRIIPLIDQIHRLMHLWKAGDVVKVDDYLNSKSLRTNALFAPVLQAVIEMAGAGSEERSILESLSKHVQGRSVQAAYQAELPGAGT